MATYATLTVPVLDIIGADFNTSRASVWIEPNVPVVLADSIRVGGRREQVVGGVATFANLVTTDTADNPASFGYRVTITAPPKGAAGRKDIVTLTTADFPFTATANLKDIPEAWDNIVLPVEWRSAFRVEMEALRDETATISGLTGEDAAVAFLVGDEGSETAAALSATYATLGAASADNLPTPFFISHRGGGALYPEETYLSFDSAIAHGTHAIEVDLQLLADGTLVPMHDLTVDRTTTSTGNVADKTLPDWSNLVVEAADDAVGTWPTEHPPTMADVLVRYGNRVCIAAQCYSVAVVEALDALVTRMGVSKRTILVQAASTAYADAAVAAGFPVAVLHDSPASFNLPAYKAAGYAMVGCLVNNITQSFIDAAHAEGFRVITYSLFRQKRVDELVAMGVDGIFTDDPAYHCNREAIERTTDAFHTQRRWPGQHTISGSRGSFTAPDEWGFPYSAGVTSIQRLGYLRPPDPSNFTLTFDANITNSNATSTLGFQIWVGNDDYWVNGGAGAGRTNDGYLMSAQAATTTGLSIEHYEDNVRTSYVKYRQPVASYADNTWYTYRLTVTPTTIKWERTDDPASAFTATHSLTRPLPYVVLVGLIAGVKFRNFTVT